MKKPRGHFLEPLHKCKKTEQLKNRPDMRTACRGGICEGPVSPWFQKTTTRTVQWTGLITAKRNHMGNGGRGDRRPVKWGGGKERGKEKAGGARKGGRKKNTTGTGTWGQRSMNHITA